MPERPTGRAPRLRAGRGLRSLRPRAQKVDPPRRSRAGAGEGRQWRKAIVVCRVSEMTSQVKSSQRRTPYRGSCVRYAVDRAQGQNIALIYHFTLTTHTTHDQLMILLLYLKQ